MLACWMLKSRQMNINLNGGTVRKKKQQIGLMTLWSDFIYLRLFS